MSARVAPAWLVVDPGRRMENFNIAPEQVQEEAVGGGLLPGGVCRP